jgi:hypothetical protein
MSSPAASIRLPSSSGTANGAAKSPAPHLQTPEKNELQPPQPSPIPPARSRLTPWTLPTSKPNPTLATRPDPDHSNPLPTERWTIRVKDPHADDLWVTGDFINWRLPGLHMTHLLPGEWEVVLTLPPGDHQFACYQFCNGKGFQRLTHQNIAHALLPGTLTSSLRGLPPWRGKLPRAS